MRAEVKALIERHELIEHPEGGWYKETYRSGDTVKNRNLLTSIYFLLTAENPSNFHRIKSDELWFFHEGDGLAVHTIADGGYQVFNLGLKDTAEPFHVVKANTIFGSSVDQENGYAFVSCAVAPGFDFRDFELFDRNVLLEKYPEHNEIITRLTKG